MTTPTTEQSRDQRRRLLKGALGASSVVTLGYGASAAAASLECVTNVITDGGYPLEQFAEGSHPPRTQTGQSWAWEKVEINTYKVRGLRPGNNGVEHIRGYTVDGRVYVVPGSSSYFKGHEQLLTWEDVKNSRQDGWVLAYFDEKGNRVGTFPNYQAAGERGAPAQHSCLNSINPSAAGSFTFGG